MSIRQLLDFSLALIALIVIALAGMLCWQTIEQMDALRAGSRRIEAIKALANIQGFLSSERGANTLALGQAEAGRPAGLAPLRQSRALTDAAIATALARVDTLAATARSEAPLLAQTDAMVAELAASRRLCDAQLARPLAQRGDAAKQMFDQMTGINAELAVILHAQISELASVNGSAYAASRIANQAASLRIVAGAQAGLLQAWVVDARPVGRADQDRFLVYEGQVQQVWEGLLAERTEATTSPELKTAIDQVQTGFLDAYGAIKAQLAPHFPDGAFPMDGDTYRARTQPLYVPVIALRDGAYEASLRAVRHAEAQARAQMTAAIVVTLLALFALRAVVIHTHRKLTNLAMRDTLVGLPNRRLLDDRLTKQLDATQRNGGHFALMFLDIDNFKTINDACGHHVGDQLLVTVARRLCDTLRSQDTVARVGGDEFVLLAEIHGPDDAAAIAQKLIRNIERPVRIAEQELHVTASIGIAVYPSGGTTRHELMTNADAAMYHAKELGKNNYRFHDAALVSDAKVQLSLQNDLHLALERREFELHYQPKFSCADMAVTGAEALLRWRHPARGLIAPAQFIPLAEKTGLIVPIGHWVLNEACRQMAAWHGQGHGCWTIAVNLSPLQFSDDRLVDDVREALARHALRPGSLTLEITESTAMRDADASVATLKALNALGVRISVDDFGSGYSSLLYLKRFSAAELKIDRGFVAPLVRGSEDAAIVSAIVALGRTLGMEVVAEGVETPAQQALLVELGCHGLQGYLLGRPQPAAAFHAAAALAREAGAATPAEGT